MNGITRATADDRVFYLDFCRASFLLLGIVLHAALPFVPGGGWLIAAPERSETIYYIYKTVNSFRMHGFFLIAGLLAVLTIRNRPSVWFRTRVARLGIPLVCAGLLLLPFESIARTLHGDADPASIGSLVVSGLREHATPGFHLVSHLWFLVDLLLFSAILAFASGVCTGKLADGSRAFMEAIVRIFLARPFLLGSLLVGLLFVYIEVLIALGYRAGWRVSFVGDDFHYSIKRIQDLLLRSFFRFWCRPRPQQRFASLVCPAVRDEQSRRTIGSRPFRVGSLVQRCGQRPQCRYGDPGATAIRRRGLSLAEPPKCGHRGCCCEIVLRLYLPSTDHTLG